MSTGSCSSRGRSFFAGRRRMPRSVGSWLSLAVLALLFIVAGAPGAVADDPPDDDSDGYNASVDCNDNNAAVHPDALEICNGIDDNCVDGIDEIPDTDPVDGVDNDSDGLVDEGRYFCVFNESGPGGVCKTGGRAVCVFPAGPVAAPAEEGQPDLHLTCVQRGDTLVIYADETLAAGNCQDGIDNDCDSDVELPGLVDRTDIHDTGCQEPEKCDGVDNDGDGLADEDFDIGDACSAGVGGCARPGNIVCTSLSSAACSATPGPAKKEGAQFGSSCDNGVDDDCDTFTDLADLTPGAGGETCAGFGADELCNGIDDDNDGTIDEGFALKGLACSVGLGACTNAGTYVCKADGSGTECSVSPLPVGTESEAASTCADFVDNDCDGHSDAADADCASAYADLGVTCSLPYKRGRPGSDCNGWHEIHFSGGQATDVQADLIAMAADGSEMAVIQDVKTTDIAHLASRIDPADFHVDSKVEGLPVGGMRHTIFAPLPMMRVTGRKGTNVDVAYCSMIPYLEVLEPKDVTISLSESDNQEVKAYLPLVNVDTLTITLDGVNILAAAGINPATSFPTGAGALCTVPGSCVFQLTAGCGDGSLVNVEIADLRVEGLDTALAIDAKTATETPNQVNTVSFTVKGLPAGGHIFRFTGSPLPLTRRITAECLRDDLIDTGTLSAFGITIDKPFDQEIVASAPVQVQGTVCSGNPVTRLRINGGEVPVDIPAHQTCTTGNGTSTADECVVDFDTSLPKKNLADAVAGDAVNASYKRGGNRVVADASDDEGNRTFNTDVEFSLHDVDAADAAAMLRRLPRDSGIRKLVDEVQAAMATNIDPAFVVGLEEAAAQKFFNEKCQGAIDQFSAKAQSALSGKTFATFDVQPDCSCDLNDVPVVLESLTFTPSAADPTCKVDFQAGKIGVKVNLPAIHIQVGAHRSCTDHGLFGECIARTKVDVTAVTHVTDISFEFTITENQIETKTPPNKDDFFFTWNIFDPSNRSAILTKGHCSNKPERECYGNKKPPDPAAGTSDMCDGAACDGFQANSEFNPITHQNVGIECWGASVCLAFEAIAAVLVTIFTFGLVDGFELVGFLDFDIAFEQDFFDELKASEPDAMGLNEVEVDEGKVSNSGFAKFTIGQIDVKIQEGGLTVAVPAGFETTSIDSTIPHHTPDPPTPADAPTVSQLIGTTDDVSMLVADDTFNQVFKSMQEAGKLKLCSSADALQVDDLLPKEVDGGCESFGPDTAIGAGLRGICHAIRGADCPNLPAEDTDIKTGTKRGTCQGFQGSPCSAFTILQPLAKTTCIGVPHIDIQASDSVLICARQDFAPDLTIDQTVNTAPSVTTNLFLEDLNVVFALDRGNDGYNGTLEALPGCWGAAANGQPDCRVYAACADLDVKTNMAIDSSTCKPNEAGFVFSLLSVVPTSLQLGAICGAGTDSDDASILEQAVQSLVTKAVADNTDTFMPPICVEGLDLNGVLDFNSPDARLFGFTTNGGTGFADFLGITVGLGSPE
jgi:putative metal-binding protein